MTSSLREPRSTDPAQVAVTPSPRSASRTATGALTARSAVRRLWPLAGGLVAGCLAAALLLNTAVGSEFPLFSEASAERGRDCATITSARHALDATLQARLPLRAHDAEAARAIRSAVASFQARTQDLATDSVVSALGPVRGGLSALSDSVTAYAASASGVDDTAVDAATDAVRDAWLGPIARVCS